MHLVTTYHPRCWEDMLLRCSLDAERLGQVIGIALYQSATSFYYGDVRQRGEPLVCGTSVSQFDSDASH